MIKLHKGQEPTVLRDNANSWTKVLQDHALAGTEPSKSELTRYGHKDIKAALLLETNNKCAYCESSFRHVSPGDVEHIVPKRLDPQFYFLWSNLTIACSVCNTNKGTKENLLDPYVDDPESQILFLGPMAIPLPADLRAGLTESVLQLNRLSLIERRAEHLRGLHRIVTLALAQPDDAAKRIFLDEVIKETAGDSQYASMTRSYVRGLQALGLI